MDFLLRDYTDDDETEYAELKRFCLHFGITTILHPLEYSRVLMQFGYEPIQPQLSHSVWGEPILLLPNIFQYVSHIRKIDGWTGCYRGLTPKMLGHVLSTMCSQQIVTLVGLSSNVKWDSWGARDPELYQFRENLKRDLVFSVSSVVIAQPFTVISIRMMAQFIGRETTYNTIFGSIREIYVNEGIMGFFAGLVPKLIWNVGALVISSSMVYWLNKHCITDKLMRQYNAGFMPLIVSQILYPFQLVSNCMAVTASGLMAGRPPIMAEYRNWLDCFNDLSARGALGRGKSPFRRPAGEMNMNSIHRIRPFKLVTDTKYI